MAPKMSATSGTSSKGQKRKRGQASRSTAKSQSQAKSYHEKMDVDNESEGSSCSSNPLDPNILDDLDITHSGWITRREEASPEGVLDPIHPVGDGGQPQGYLAWHQPLQAVDEDVETALAAVAALQRFGDTGQPTADGVDVDEVSTSYATDTTYLDFLLSLPIEDLDPAALQQLRVALEDPWYGIEILETKHGFPYSFVETGTKRYVCRCASCTLEPFENLSSLMKHQKHHQSKDDMPFKCKSCSAAFALRHYLLRHGLSHSDVRKWACSTCGASFKRKDALDKHQKSKSGCDRFRRKTSTVSGSEVPTTPDTFSQAARSRRSKGKQRASSSSSPLQGLAAQLDQVEIQSNSSYPFPLPHNPGPYY